MIGVAQTTAADFDNLDENTAFRFGETQILSVTRLSPRFLQPIRKSNYAHYE